jgi:transposase-like protein
MKLKNSFKEEDRGVYAFTYDCINCGSNQSCELHHVLGRSGRYNNSILNSSFICRKCHEKYTELSKPYLLQITLKLILKEGYDLKERDVRFYKTNEAYYKKRIKEVGEEGNKKKR